MNEYKVYVDVMAIFTADGRLIPRGLKWEDGRLYEITAVKDVRRACSLKAGGTGTRYTCIADGKEMHLFHENENLWFVERKNPRI